MQHEIQINKPDITVTIHSVPRRGTAGERKAWKKNNDHESTETSQNRPQINSPKQILALKERP